MLLLFLKSEDKNQQRFGRLNQENEQEKKREETQNCYRVSINKAAF